MKINKWVILLFSFLLVFILMLANIRTDSTQIATKKPPIYCDSEIIKITTFYDDSYIIFSRTKDTMAQINSYYKPYIEHNKILFMTSKGYLRVVGEDEDGIFIITTYKDGMSSGMESEYDARLRVDVGGFNKVEISNHIYDDVFIPPTMENSGFFITSATVSELVNYYAFYDDLCDVRLFNHELRGGEDIIFSYEDGISVFIRSGTLNEETQNSMYQVEIKVR